MNFDLFLIDNKLNIVKSLALFLLGFGVVVENGTIVVISLLFAIWSCILDKERYFNLKNNIFNNTIILISIYLSITFLLCIFKENFIGMKSSLKLLEQITSFLIVFILLGDISSTFKFSFLGIALGVLTGEISIAYEILNDINIYGYRYGGIWGHPNSAGAVLELVFPLLIYILYKNNQNKVYVLLLGLFILGLFASVFASGSRGAILALLAETIVFGGIYFFRKYKFKSLCLYILSIAFIGLSILYIFVHFFPRNYDIERYLAYQSTWNMILDNPLTGVGYTKWREIYRAYYVSPLAKDPDLVHAHNAYLYILAETGIIGFLTFFSIIYYQIKESICFSSKYFKEFRENINIADMFLAIICGCLVHNMVDVYFMIKFYMLIYLFIWGICCFVYKNNIKY